MKTRTIITKVAGVTYENRQDTIAKMTGREPARIVPEPTNPYDKNALAVHVAMDDGTIAHVGFVPRDLAAIIAPHLEGEQVMCSIREITGGFEKWDGTLASFGLQILVEYPIDDTLTDRLLAGSETLADDFANGPRYADEERDYSFGESPDDYDLPNGS